MKLLIVQVDNPARLVSCPVPMSVSAERGEKGGGRMKSINSLRVASGNGFCPMNGAERKEGTGGGCRKRNSTITGRQKHSLRVRPPARARIQTHTHAHTHTHIHSYTRTLTHAHAHTHTHTRTRTHRHTQNTHVTHTSSPTT